MSVHVLPAPCWVVQWDGLPLDGRNASHYATRAAAARAVPAGGRLARHRNCGGTVYFAVGAWCGACEQEMACDDDWELLRVTPARLPSPCWVAECDCDCHYSGDLLRDDDGYVIHEETDQEITARAWEQGWQVTVTGLVYPDEDSVPPGAVLAARPPARHDDPPSALGPGPAPAAVTADGPRAVLAAAGPCMAVLIGAAASGKSTLALQLASDGAEVLSLDALCQRLSGDPYNPRAVAAATAQLRLLAGQRLSQRLTVIVDAVNVDAGERVPLAALARSHGLPAVAVVMNTPLTECLARNERRPAPAPGTSRWGTRVPGQTVRDQHAQAQQAVPLLAAEGFTYVIHVGGRTGARPGETQ